MIGGPSTFSFTGNGELGKGLDEKTDLDKETDPDINKMNNRNI